MKTRFIAYYRKSGMRFLETLPEKMKTQDFFSNYTPVEVLKAEGLEEVYRRMQGENWSPNGEMREYIKVLGLSHTSMSVGDAIYSQAEDKFYLVDNFGWTELELTL